MFFMLIFILVKVTHFQVGGKAQNTFYVRKMCESPFFTLSGHMHDLNIKIMLPCGNIVSLKAARFIIFIGFFVATQRCNHALRPFTHTQAPSRRAT